MKTKIAIPILVFLLCFQQVINAQTLKSKIQKSVVEIGDTFPEIPMNRLKHLDQVAFLIFKKINKSKKVDVVLIDMANQEISQFAMIWLQTGIIYYGHNDMFNIQSAGITPQTGPIPKLETLKEYGFSMENTRGENPASYKINYGSGSWIVYPKSLESLNSNSKTHFKIYLENYNTEKNKIDLLFSDITSIPREMLYIATRINNLLQTKQ